MKIVYAKPGGHGWAPIAHLARLMAQLLEAQFIEVDATKPVSRAVRALSLAPRRRAGEDVLLIAPQPGDLYRLVDLSSFVAGRGHTAAWVIDSWWTDRIPRLTGTAHHVDHIYLTEAADLEAWRATGNVPVSWLPLGSDVLGEVAHEPVARDVDVQRVGRQPAEWDDDEANARALAGVGLSYAGRPPFGANDEESHAQLRAALRRAKFALAFTNAASQADYTHGTREYLTPRWLDAISSGCVVAGIPPRGSGVADLLWPSALLELSSAGRTEGIAELAAAVAAYDHRTALKNQYMALGLLDWRHRALRIADDFGRSSAVLEGELVALQQAQDAVLQRLPSDPS